MDISSSNRDYKERETAAVCRPRAVFLYVLITHFVTSFQDFIKLNFFKKSAFYAGLKPLEKGVVSIVSR